MSDNIKNNGAENPERGEAEDFEEIDDFFDESVSYTIKDDAKEETEKISAVMPDWAQTAPAEKNKEYNILRKIKKKSRKIKKKIRKFRKLFLIAPSVIAGLLLIIYISCIITLPKDTVAHNVMIENMDAGGLTYEETLESVRLSYMFETQNISVVCKDRVFDIDGRKIGLYASPEATAQKAFSYGKSGNVFKDGLCAMRLLVSKKVIVPAAEVDFDMINQQLGEIGVELFGLLTQHKIEITDAGAVITPGKTGFDYNTDTAREQVISAVREERFYNIPVTLSSCPPDELSVEYVDAAIYKDPENARYEINGNSVEVVPDVNGRYCSRDEVAAAIPLVREGGEPVTVPYYESAAAVSAQTLHDKLFQKSIGSYSTDYSGSDANRSANVARAASLINGKVLASGETFSFNDTVGDRTSANGFYKAKEYVNGQSVDGIGGGTCQVSSTLYSAALYADLGIVHRENHMMTVSYMPAGQDATVAYGSVDFKFKNTTDYPIKIAAYTNGGRITVSIIGTPWEPERSVELKHSVSYNDNGYTIVKSKRLVYANGECISEDSLGTSSYAPHQTQTSEEDEEE